jgi:hypothetical protein
MRGGGGDVEAFYVCDFFTHKFSPRQLCQGVSHHMCFCVKFTLKLILGHNTTYVL